MAQPSPLFRERRFLRDWIIAISLGLAVGSLLDWYIPRYALTAAKGLEQGLGLVIPNQGIKQVLLALPSYVVTTTRAGALVGLCLTLAQWVVLRKWQVAWAREWLVAGSVGAVVSYLLMAALHILEILLDPDPRFLKGLADSGLWIGAIMGIAQWRVLQTYSRRAGWWVAFSVGMWGSGTTLDRLFGQMAARRLGVWLALPFQWVLGGELVPASSFLLAGLWGVWIIAGVVGGLLTAKVLEQLVIQWPIPDKG